MERALNGTKMGGSKLVVNLARYSKENAGFKGGKYREEEANVKKQPVSAQEVKNQYQKNVHGRVRLFSDLFKSDPSNSVSKSNPAVEVGISIDIVDNTSAFSELTGRALVGRCKDLVTLRTLNSILAENKTRGVSLSYLGGLSMLLKFDSEESCVNLLMDHHRWKSWFSNLDPWNCQSLPFERLVWVKVQGVPMHLVENDVINNIAEHFGKVVHGSQLSSDDDNI
ncbi:hypothetical protein HanPI659440_Chr12g0473371 [Helianthus annuus]|nr:hypothetical protein HanPI659440_Chr12g0473371 [Helianthus annuus]